jgi:hypothetical protein
MLTRRQVLTSIGAGSVLFRAHPEARSSAVSLIFDEQSVESHQGVSFHLNRATKHPENPVLLPGAPHQWDSLQVAWPATVLYSPSDKKFRCWYTGLDVVQSPERRFQFGYAESDDGVHWIKPALGQVLFLDRPTNQIKVDWNGRVLSFVFENPAHDESERRFGSLWLEGRSPKVKGLAYSPDGARWTRDATVYVPTKGLQSQDISQIIHDPEETDAEFRIKCYSQIYVPQRSASGRQVRGIGLVHGSDIHHLHDAVDRLMMAPQEGIDEEVHFSTVRKVGGIFLMLFESDRFSTIPMLGDLKLAVSSDGRKFRRVHPHSPLVATGQKGMWDENLLVTTTSAMQEVGDEVYIFYIGCPNLFNAWPGTYAVTPTRRGSYFAPTYMGLATLPRDRYAYAKGLGILTTNPADSGPDGPWLNVDGDVREIAAISESGGIVARGHMSEERHQSVYRKIVWKHRRPASTIRLRITLGSEAKLYSIQSRIGGA